MRCVSWDEFHDSSEAILEEALRCGTPIYVKRGRSIVLEIMPAALADEAEEGGVTTADRAAVAELWCEQQLASDHV